MFKIGINENQVLSKVSINEQPTYSFIEFNFGGDAPAELNPFQQTLDADGYASTGGGGSILRFFAPKPAEETKTDGTPRTAIERAQDTFKSITELMNLLQQFALCYTTSDKINLREYTKNTGITPENWVTSILSPAALSQITKNLVSDFNRDVQDYLGKNEDDYKLRVICIRNSKGYPELRKYYIKDNPVVEPMKKPCGLKFTKKELDNGLDKDAPVTMVPDVDPNINAAAIFSQATAAE